MHASKLAYPIVFFYIQITLTLSLFHLKVIMVKLIALYKPPEDKAAFDQHYADIHTPLVMKMPGLRKLEVAQITGAPIGEPKHYLIAEMFFDNQEAMTSALASSEGKATARDLMSFASTLVTMMYAEVR